MRYVIFRSKVNERIAQCKGKRIISKDGYLSFLRYILSFLSFFFANRRLTRRLCKCLNDSFFLPSFFSCFFFFIFFFIFFSFPFLSPSVLYLPEENLFQTIKFLLAKSLEESMCKLRRKYESSNPWLIYIRFRRYESWWVWEGVRNRKRTLFISRQSGYRQKSFIATPRPNLVGCL